MSTGRNNDDRARMTGNERSPMDLMLEGSMEHLLLVREYVDAAAWR